MIFNIEDLSEKMYDKAETSEEGYKGDVDEERYSGRDRR